MYYLHPANITSYSFVTAHYYEPQNLQLEYEDLRNRRQKWPLLAPETAAFPPVTLDGKQPLDRSLPSTHLFCTYPALLVTLRRRSWRPSDTCSFPAILPATKRHRKLLTLSKKVPQRFAIAIYSKGTETVLHERAGIAFFAGNLLHNLRHYCYRQGTSSYRE